MTRALLVLVVCLVVTALSAGTSVQAGPMLWYDSQASWSADTHLYSYDLTTGVKTDRGAIPGAKLMTDIAFDNAGQLYGLAFNNMNGSGQGKLFAVTPGSADSPGSFTQLNITGKFSGAPNGLAYHEGALYVSSWDKQFYKLTQSDGNNWSIAAQGRLGYAAVGDLTIGADGTMYAAVINGNRTQLATVNYDTTDGQFGQATLSGGPITSANYVFGLVKFGDTMYGTTSNDNFANSILVTIDPLSGATTRVADLGQPVWGMTFTGAPAAVPEPATMALLGCGLAGLVIMRRKSRHVGPKGGDR